MRKRIAKVPTPLEAAAELLDSNKAQLNKMRADLTWRQNNYKKVEPGSIYQVQGEIVRLELMVKLLSEYIQKAGDGNG